jgi:alkyl hydroperoxide reductase subunit AhpF
VNVVAYKDLKTSELKEVLVDGVFVEIGWVPNSDLVKDLAACNKAGEIIVDQKTQATSCEGIWAAGDVTDGLYKQNNISMGDGVKAILNIYEYLNRRGVGNP